MTKPAVWKFFASIMAAMMIVALGAGVIAPARAIALSGITPVYVNEVTGNNANDGSSPVYVSGAVGPKATVTAGISAVSPGGTVNVAAGTYIESNILVSNGITIQGTGATRDDVVVAPAAEDGNADNAFLNSAQNGFVIAAHDVTIKNLTINGRGNPALTAGKNNFRAGIVTLDTGGAWNNLHVDNIYIKYPYRRGISVFPRSVYGTIVQNSTVEYVAFNHGMYIGGQSQVLNNTVRHCFQGIVQDPDASTTNTDLIKANGNTLTQISNFPGVWGYPDGQPRAIQPNPTGPARTFEVKNNIIDDIGSVGLVGTVGIYTRWADANSILDNNTITLTSGTSWDTPGVSQSVGMLLGWSYANGFMASNNHVNSSGYGMGVMVFGSGTVAKPMLLEGNTIIGTSSTRITQGDGTGIYIANQYLFASDKNESYVIIRNGNAISGFVRGIDIEKVVSTDTYPLTVVVNNNSITGNTTGIDASTLTTAIDATNNWWGSNTGPGPVGPGTGDKVTVNVTFSPWTIHNAPIPVPSPAGTITVASSAGTLDMATDAPVSSFPTTGLPPLAEMPYGVISFTVSNLTPGATVTMTFTLPTVPPANLQFWKYINGAWVDCSSLLSGVADGNNTVFVTITDGGLGDQDGLANGVIVDPCAFVYPSIPMMFYQQSHGASMPAVTTPQAPVSLPSVIVQSASLSANTVSPGSPVTVTADITNKSTVNGIKKVTLYVNGQVESTQGITVNSGGSSKLTFSVSRNEPGTYSIYVDGVPAGSLTVSGGPPGEALIFAGFIAFIALILGLMVFYARRQRTG